MKFIRPALACGITAVALVLSASAQDEAELQLLKKINDAIVGAPGLRITATQTDRDSGAVTMATVIERVKPGRVRFVMTRNGEPGREMISDGTRSLSRNGPNDPWRTLPINVSKLFEQSQRSFSEEGVREEHGRLKLLGDDTVNGVAAKVYELSGDHGTGKMWIDARDSRPLKVESDSTGPAIPPGIKPDAKGKPDINALRAQMQAARAERHVHTSMTYDYDPSLKIDLPAKP